MELKQLQVNAIEAWNNKEQRGIVELPTGTGKTLIGLETIKEQIKAKPNSIIMIAVTTNHLEEHWKNYLTADQEISNSIQPKGTAFILVSTIQTLYKATKKYADLLIFDESHHSPAVQWIQFLRNNKFKSVLFLTATSGRDDKRNDILKEEFKIDIVYQATQADGVKEKLLCEFIIINKSVELLGEELLKYERIKNFIANNFKFYNYDFTVVRQRAYEPIASELMKCFTIRKNILNNAASKIDAVGDILSTTTYNKAIIFTEYINYAEKIQDFLKSKNVVSASYHSKAKNKQTILEDFKSGKIQVLICVKGLDEGLNVPDADVAIIVASSSQTRQTIQRIGRVLRYAPDKVAKIYNLYVKDSKEEQWLKKRMSTVKGYTKMIWE
jgi:superfamily II DNA or RNA helicase|tara:strand:- start:11034 stop:12185 length:1152 start_codon:yes stop_codon:yes gene_type:complete